MQYTYIVVDENGNEVGRSSDFSQAVSAHRSDRGRAITTPWGASNLDDDGKPREMYQVSQLDPSGQGKFVRKDYLVADRLTAAYKTLVSIGQRARELGDDETADMAIALVLYTFCTRAKETQQTSPKPNFCIASNDAGGDLHEVYNDKVVLQMGQYTLGVAVTHVNPAVWLTMLKPGVLVIPHGQDVTASDSDTSHIEIGVLRSQLKKLSGECYILAHTLPESTELFETAHLLDACDHVLLPERTGEMVLYAETAKAYEALKDSDPSMINPDADDARTTLKKLVEMG